MTKNEFFRRMSVEHGIICIAINISAEDARDLASVIVLSPSFNPLFLEQIADTRIIPIQGSPHAFANVMPRNHIDMVVIDTTNMPSAQGDLIINSWKEKCKQLVIIHNDGVTITNQEVILCGQRGE